MSTLYVVQTVVEQLNEELQSLQRQIAEDERRSGQPGFTSDDWKRLGGNRVAEGHIKKAIRELDRAVPGLLEG
jgi:hypothetical protein